MISRLALGARRDAREQRQLVDHRRNFALRGRCAHCRAQRGRTISVADSSPPRWSCSLELRSRAHSSQRSKKAGARLVDAHVRRARARPRRASAASAAKNAADDGSPGTVDVERLERSRRREATPAFDRSPTSTPSARSMRSVWSRDVAALGHAHLDAAHERGEQDRALHLRARRSRSSQSMLLESPP